MNKQPAYTDEDKQRIMQHVCEEIAAGYYLTDVLREEGMPDRSTIYGWINKNPEFERMYWNAYTMRSYGFLEKIEALHDEEKTPVNEMPNGAWDSAHVTWIRDKTNALQWKLQKLLPKRFGDLLKIAGDDDQAPIRISDAEASHKIAAILAGAKARREKEGSKDEE